MENLSPLHRMLGDVHEIMYVLSEAEPLVNTRRFLKRASEAARHEIGLLCFSCAQRNSRADGPGRVSKSAVEDLQALLWSLV